METFVVGKIPNERANNGSIQGVIERLSPFGYKFSNEGDGHKFTKVGRVESIITEMVPVCEDHGLDVEDFQLVEYRSTDGLERSRYLNGKIIRD